jgi:hypothetical protein
MVFPLDELAGGSDERVPAERQRHNKWLKVGVYAVQPYFLYADVSPACLSAANAFTHRTE